MTEAAERWAADGQEPLLGKLVLIHGALNPKTGKPILGSGFAVTADLVLTARHVVGELGETCRVVVRGVEHAGVVIWTAAHLGLDAALVKVPGSPWADVVGRQSWAELHGVAEAKCISFGYPWAQADEAGTRKVEHGLWRVMPATGYEDHRYAMSTLLASPRDRPKGSPWAGNSGGPLLSEDGAHLLGVLVADPVRHGAGRIEAVRVRPLLADPSFAFQVGAGVDRLEKLFTGESAQLGDIRGIVRHSDEKSGLTGLMRHLREDSLPFVYPPPESPAHPERLLERLGQVVNKQGLLLVGVAGAGKTRTTMQVGDLAEQRGWTVLHVKAGEPKVTEADLTTAIERTQSKRVLVVIDYLNQCSGLDLIALRHRVLPEARAADVQVALLASARLGWFEDNKTRLEPLFRPVRLHPSSEQTEEIRVRIVKTVAPKATELLGTEDMLRLGGPRPVTTMLIAAEAEELADAGRLTRSSLNDIRSGDLVTWINLRFAEDTAALGGPDHLLACAVIASVCPQAPDALLTCAESVVGSREEAEHVLGVLTKMHWLVEGPTGLTTVHDTVADRLLEHVLLWPVSDILRAAVADRVLSAALTSPRSFGRLAGSLDRLVRDLDVEDRAGSLREGCAAWLRDNAERVGRMLRDDADEGGFALGSVVDNQAWASNIITWWDAVAGQWLAEHAERHSARHLLYKGLRAKTDAADPPLVLAALRWLTQHRYSFSASFVLSSLIPCQMTDNDRGRVVGNALRWLRHHNATSEARFVLSALLGTDLDDVNRPRVVGYALSWLEAFHTQVSASHVLSPLLPLALRDADRRRATKYALSWLDAHRTQSGASHVFTALLPADLDTAARDRVAGHALAWLHVYNSQVAASHVLSALLPVDIKEIDRQRATEYALTWLEAHHAQFVASHVLRALLTVDLAEAELRGTAGYAITWLESHHRHLDAQFVLSALLPVDLDDADRRRATGYALAWLDAHHEQTVASHVLSALLPEDMDDLDRQRATHHALTWLDQHGLLSEAQFVFSALLPTGLAGDDRERAVRLGLRWLDAFHLQTDVSFVLRVLLPVVVGDDEQAKAVGIAFAWLDVHHRHPEAQFVLGALLPVDLGPDDQRRAVRFAFSWLEAHREVTEAQFVLRALLSVDLGDEDRQRAAGDALFWLERHHRRSEAQFVLSALLPIDLSDADRARAARFALAWLDVHGTGLSASHVLSTLLPSDLADDDRHRAGAHAVAWLDVHHEHLSASHVLSALLPVGLERERVVGFALAWLDVHHAHTDASYVLRVLLPVDAGPRSMSHAVAWLDDHHTEAVASHVMNVLLTIDVAAADRAMAVRYALVWLDAHHLLFEAQYILRPLLLDHASDGVVRHALSWLDEHGAMPESSFVLNPLLAAHLTGQAEERATRHALRWLDAHHTQSDADFVLNALLATDLAAEDAARVIEQAVGWLDRHHLDHDPTFLITQLLRRDAHQWPCVYASVSWCFRNLEDPGVVWSASRIFREFDERRSVLLTYLAVVEAHFRVLPKHAVDINGDSVYDGVVDRFCRSEYASRGVLGNRLDDLVQFWVTRPESLSPNCTDGTYFNGLVTRITGLVYGGKRFDPAVSADVLTRLRAWIGHWRCPDHPHLVERALAEVDFALDWLG